jgi:hypothetical protein
MLTNTTVCTSSFDETPSERDVDSSLNDVCKTIALIHRPIYSFPLKRFIIICHCEEAARPTKQSQS